MTHANINEGKPARWREPELSGSMFGKWQVLAADSRRGRKSYWICRCTCGNQRSVSGWALRKGRSRQCRSCGTPFRRFEDLTGRQAGWLVVIAYAGRDARGRARWRCRCDRCKQNTVIVAAYHLRAGRIKSCGCYRRELLQVRTRAANEALRVLTQRGSYGVPTCYDVQRRTHCETP